MKKSILLVLLTYSFGYAQVVAPQPSPSTTVKQVVGLTDVELSYSRPSMRGRTIMGALVPYGEMWRTGANRNTTLQFSDAVLVEGKSLAAGTYALFTRPGKALWEVFFYTKTDNGGLPSEWDAKAVALVVEVTPTSLNESVETFTIALENLHNNGATLSLNWENTSVPIQVEVPTDSKTMASITKTMNNNPNADDMYAAAVYYLQNDKDLNKAKEWITKSIAMEDGKYWVYRQQSLILAALNEKDAALEAAKKSLALVEAAGNQDYVRLNTAAIAEWSK